MTGSSDKTDVRGGWFPAREITNPGLYVRCNPPARRRLFIEAFEGESYGLERGLWFIGNEGKLYRIEELSPRMLAYGPIPCVPNWERRKDTKGHKIENLNVKRGTDSQQRPCSTIDDAIRERDAYFAEAARTKQTLADIIPALEVASKCNADELRATCPGNELTPDEWAALWMARAILEVDSSNKCRSVLKKPKPKTESAEQPSGDGLSSSVLFGMLRPFPAPIGAEILFWNGSGWFIGHWDGVQFNEDGSGWSCAVSVEDCGFILLPKFGDAEMHGDDGAMRLLPNSVVSSWRREAQKSREHATKWMTTDNKDGRPNAAMAEVCTMRAMTLEACANHLEKAANVQDHR